MEPKQIYLTRRQRALDAAAWTPRWRQHGRFVRSLPLWDQIRHYEQCGVLPAEQAGAAAMFGLAEGYDGVGMVWFRSLSAVREALADPTVGSVFEDEKDVFDDPIADTSVFTREVVFRDTGATTIKLVGFLRRKPGLTREQFSEHWEQRHGPLFLSVPSMDEHVTKYVQNHVIEEYTGVMGETCDGVVEIGFRDAAAIEAAFGERYLEVVRPDEERFVDLTTMTVVATDETLLYEDALRPVSDGSEGQQDAALD
ncbi:MAG TPA: EthD family reductase, partial [Baekduia sp.]